MDTLQAAILNVKIDYYNNDIKNRQRVAKKYTELLKNHIQAPIINPNKKSVWAQYSILAKDKNTRDSIVSYLKENNINAAIFYPVPLHYQKCFKEKKCFDLSNTENICDRIFNLPCYAEFTRKEQDIIINLLKIKLNC